MFLRNEADFFLSKMDGRLNGFNEFDEFSGYFELQHLTLFEPFPDPFVFGLVIAHHFLKYFLKAGF
jgi:hypothetical protein